MQETTERKLRERIAPRKPIEADITCRPFSSNGAICASDGVMRNLSWGGAYIEISHQNKLGAILIVRTVRNQTMVQNMTDVELPRSICLTEVKWLQERVDENAVRYGMGLNYID